MKHRPHLRLHRRARPGPWLGLPVLLAVCAACQSTPPPAASEPSAPAAALAPAPSSPQPSAVQPSTLERSQAAALKADVAANGSAGQRGGAAAGNSPKHDDGPEKEEAPALRVRAEGQLGPGQNTLFIDIAPPDGAKLTLESPLNVRGSGGIGLEFPRRLNGPLSSHSMPLRLPIDVSDGATGPARVELTYYWCTEGNEAACRRERAHLDVELDLSGSSAGGEAHLSYRADDKS